jgi:hypothetical protein
MELVQSFKKAVHNLLQSGTLRTEIEDVDNYHGKPILQNQAGNDLIAQLLESPEPLMIARLGRTETECIVNYLEKNKRGNRAFNKIIRNKMSTFSGFFPATDEMLDRFCEEFLDHLHLLDVMGVWFNEGEEDICHTFCPDTRLVRLRCLEPYYHARPWSEKLRDKKVLVIHPFQHTIVTQFTNSRERLFADPAVLPPFHLETIRAVQTLAGAESPFATWFEAYVYMCSEMEKKDFDVAIIGAGAYGLPLAAHAKKLGKKAIHMGGATQILFGIKGKRWDNHEVISKLYNDYWVRPTADETPGNSKVVEGGCYW